MVVVMNNLKALLYDKLLSPIWIIPESDPADFTTCSTGICAHLQKAHVIKRIAAAIINVQTS